MSVNWIRIYNRFFKIINEQGPAYFSGGRFISKVKEIDPYFPDYTQYIAERNKTKKSTSRKDYFFDILLSFDETQRVKIIDAVLTDIRESQPGNVATLEAELADISKPTEPTQTVSLSNTHAIEATERKTLPETTIHMDIQYHLPKQPWFNSLKVFWKEHWQWIITTAVAIISIIVAL
ncbi:MAG: hypothetical protein LLF86_04210 [Nitrospiraceae bacterium]|nr:hypothetical protein [Nitrospiraceae bacterium]